MPFKKGQSGNAKGKPKGALSEKGKQWEKLGEAIMTTHCDRFNEILSELEPDKFMTSYLQVLEYFKPKLQRSTLVGDADNPLEVKVANFS